MTRYSTTKKPNNAEVQAIATFAGLDYSIKEAGPESEARDAYIARLALLLWQTTVD